MLNQSQTPASSSNSSVAGSTRRKDQLMKNPSINFLNILNKSRFPVYCVSSSQSDKLYAMKMFPWADQSNPSPYYLNEVRFSRLKHPNVLSTAQVENEEYFLYHDRYVKVSIIFTEYTPNGNLFMAMNNHTLQFNEKLIRTYMHQLVEGLEYLHSNGIAHLDVKPENVLFKKNFGLMLADFDLSIKIEEDKTIDTKGTKNFRAPEIYNGTCKNPKLADVYSLGIILFLMKSNGTMPYIEEKLNNGVDMFVLKECEPEKFWKEHCDYGKKPTSFFSEEFKNLFLHMTKSDSRERASLSQIKTSSWYRGETFNDKELEEYVKTQMKK